MLTFISYRRADSQGELVANLLYRELCRTEGGHKAFIDIDSSSLGLPFPRKLSDTLNSCDAVLVVIGPQWLNELNGRLDQEQDWVRFEISESLRRRTLPVVPILVGGTALPKSSDLPEDIVELACRDGISIDPIRGFDEQFRRLVAGLTVGAASNKIFRLREQYKIELEKAKTAPPDKSNLALGVLLLFPIISAFFGLMVYMMLSAQDVAAAAGVTTFLYSGLSWLLFVVEYKKSAKQGWIGLTISAALGIIMYCGLTAPSQ